MIASEHLPDPKVVRQKMEQLLLTVRHFHDWLRSFHAVAYYGSYYRAAKEIGLSAAANVKRDIEHLEEKWGGPLVEPGDQAGTPLTPMGDALYLVIRPMFPIEAQLSQKAT